MPKVSSDPATQQYNDQIEVALQAARNALQTWSAHKALGKAERGVEGGSAVTMPHQAKALAFISDIWIDALNSIISDLEKGLQGRDAGELGKPEHADATAKANIAAEKKKEDSDDNKDDVKDGHQPPPAAGKPEPKPEPKADPKPVAASSVAPKPAPAKP